MSKNGPLQMFPQNAEGIVFLVGAVIDSARFLNCEPCAVIDRAYKDSEKSFLG